MINQSATQYTLWKLDAHLRPTTLAMSRDNTLVAVGYGPTVNVFRFEGNLQSWKSKLTIEGFKTPDEVKHQVISFSNDCKYVTVSCQRYDRARGKDDDGLHTRVWRCKENMGEGFGLGHCRLPTVILRLPCLQCALTHPLSRTTSALPPSPSTQNSP